MAYLRRQDNKISVTIDSNVWNWFFDRDVRLLEALPPSRFLLFMPRHIEIELDAIPGTKAGLRAYIERETANAEVRVTATFGFARQDGGPERCGGFDFGTFQSEDERNFYASVRDRFLLGRPSRPSHLTVNEADAAVGAASLSSIVLTLDATKPGPLRAALDHGGKVFNMGTFENTGLSLAEAIERFHRA